MNIAVQSNVTPGAERFAIVLTAESDAESYDLGRVTGVLEIMQVSGGKFKDDGKAELTLVLFDRSKTASKQPAPASDKETEELAQLCIASAQEQERTCTGAPGTLSAEACRMIADALRSMKPGTRHSLEIKYENGEYRCYLDGRGYCPAGTKHQATAFCVWDGREVLNLEVTDCKNDIIEKEKTDGK